MDSEVDALNYRQFWQTCALIGLVSALLVLLLFKLDPASEEDAPTLVEAVKDGAEPAA